MNSNVPLSHALQALASTADERRAAYELEEKERAIEHRKKLALQVSALHTPHQRICIWEQLHRVRLPVQAGHPLVHVIATQTELSVRQIEVEQERRAVLRSQTPR